MTKVREYDRAHAANRDKRIVLATIRDNIHVLPTFLGGNPPDVNYALRKIFSSIFLEENGEMNITWL
jgi:hypothetical protein